VIIAPIQEAAPLFVYGHLGESSVTEGQVVEPSTSIGSIGPYRRNGFWFPHLHLQAIARDFFESKLANSIEALDGYFPKNEKDTFTKHYPEPLGALAGLSRL
jgi:hypothetical protein